MTHHDVSHQSRHEKKQGTWRIILGCASIGAYMLLFTAGAAIDSAPYRARLAPVATGAQATSSSAGSPSSAVTTPAAVSFLTAFVLVMVLFTPLNVAFLTLIAAFIGGCASNITYTRGTMRSDSGEAPSGSLLFRTESPFASMFRGFVVYLAFMAGIYITTANPFGTPTAEQYVRLSATLSLFGFIVGYDPTKFADFLKLLPGPRSAAQK